MKIEKIKHGVPAKRTLVNKVNEIIEYLWKSRPVKGPGILISESSSGTVFSASRSRNASLEDDTEAMDTAVEYSGPFAVRLAPVPEQTELSVDASEEAEEEEVVGVYVSVAAGAVVVGNVRRTVPAVSQNEPIFLPEGQTLWLLGKYTTPQSFLYEVSDSEPSVLAGRFSLKIALNTGGIIQQIQFGEIITVPWGVSDAFQYVGAFAVELQGGTSARIYNKSAQNSQYAGEVRVGNVVKSVPRGSLPITPGIADDIYLTVYYDADDNPPCLKYEFSKTLSEAVTGDQGWYKKLASVNVNGVVTQLHLSGDIEISGRWI